MTGSHRLLDEDGGLHCYSCGAYFACEDDDTDDGACETARAVDCTGPSTEHPGYYLGMIDGAPYRETCAAHPYAD